MGAFFSYYKIQSELNEKHEPKLDFTKLQIDELKTKQDLEPFLKSPHKCYSSLNGFCAHSYQEDCFLVGGGRDAYTDRIEWKDNSHYLVIYLDGDSILRKFHNF